MTQPPKFDPETVARIIDPGAFAPHRFRGDPDWHPDDDRLRHRSACTKAAAIMALHDADPARQMADAEAALWREHDARHSAELARLRADLADAVGVLEEHAILSGRAWVSQLEMLNLIRDLSALLSRLKDAKP